jgi:putative chitinase
VDAARFAPEMEEWMPRGEITTPLRVAHFMGQVLHESGMLRHVEENLNYSADGLLKTFGRYFDAASAKAYARKPEAIANRVYAGRMGNGDEASGDGWRYRGRGLIQLTGKDNYARLESDLGADTLRFPGLVSQGYAVAAAVYYWRWRNLNALADRDDVREITRKVNGGLHGLMERRKLVETAKAALRQA